MLKSRCGMQIIVLRNEYATAFPKDKVFRYQKTFLNLLVNILLKIGIVEYFFKFKWFMDYNFYIFIYLG